MNWVMRLLKQVSIIVALLTGLSSAEEVFPHKMPEKRPDIPLSASADRMFAYPAPRLQDNELYSLFKYTKLEGFDYAGGDGTVTRRDPSRPILVNGRYYAYYTKRDTETPPIGASRAAEATDSIPSTDWDLCEIWYATSEDGFVWEERGVAVPRPPKPQLGWRSVTTPDVLVWKGKYYLYYQAFSEPSGTKGDWCPVTVSWADSPEGPWTSLGKQVVSFGKKGEWDQDATHDPQPIVYRGKIYLYYKAAYNKWPDVRDKYAVGQGLAIAEDPLGPFVKCPLNPILTSGHETNYFPFQGGVATLATFDGNERNTVQFAEDGINFKVASHISLPPAAGAGFSPDAFTGSGNGRGITWGLSHFITAGEAGKRHSAMTRFDCDLSLDFHDPAFKRSQIYLKPAVYYSQGLSKAQRERAEERARGENSNGER